MVFVSIGGVALPTPTYYSVETRDIDSSDSGRADESGVVHRNVVRSGIKICDVKWKVNGSDAATIHSKLSAPKLSAVIFDPAACTTYSCEMYADNLKSSFYQHQNGSSLSSYWEISCRLTEY